MAPEGAKRDGGHMNGGFVDDSVVMETPFSKRTVKASKGGDSIIGLAYKTQGEDETTDGQSSTRDNQDVDVKKPMVGFFELFRFSDRLDKLLMILGLLAAMAHGLAYPTNLLIYGDVLDLFIEDEIAKQLNLTLNISLNEEIQKRSVYFSLVAVGVLILGSLQMILWMMAAERQAHRIRQIFFHKVMNQTIGWFDTNQTAEVSSRLAEDVEHIQNGIGDKLAMFIQHSSTFIGGFVLGFVRGWELALIIMSMTPLMVVALVLIAKIVQKYTGMQLTSYARAGAIAEEVLASIRTVAAFGGEQKESERYNSNLEGARKVGVKKGLYVGLGVGFVWVTIFSCFSLAMWYGAKLVRESDVSGGHVLQVFSGVLIGSIALGNAAPTLEHIATARGAAAAIFGTIDLESEIDPSSEEGEKPGSIEGNVEFSDVSFHYPSRPEVQVMTNFSISVNVGQTVALVGSSGCGKSTTVQLLQRFYDPIEGLVKLDGRDIRELNIKWLRKQIGVVSQEPVLFATTIRENIRYGFNGVSDRDIEKAARQANAHDFIMKLPQQYNTLVGERGAQMSGGQKQRIAIARALVRNPKILLLDEATSALDLESESVVQDALDKARQGRTTIVVAHRLSTIRNADLIIGIDQGRVAETGTHDQLMQAEGIYYTLANNQMHQQEKEKDALGAINKHTQHAILTYGSISLICHGKRPSRSTQYATDFSMEVGDDQRFGFGRQDSLYHSLRSRDYRRQLSMSAKSVTSKTSIKQDDEAELEDLPPVPIKRLLRINAPETPYIILGSISAVFVGALQPSFGVVLSEIFGNFAQTDEDKMAQTATMYSAIIFGIGLVAAIGNVLMNYLLALSGENLTMRLRQLAFQAMLRQDIGWFDDKSNQVGALTTRLATDASLVRGATGSQLGVVVQGITTLGAGVVIAFIFGWKLALLVLGFLPFTVAGGVVQARVFSGRTRDDKKMMEEAGKISSEAVENIRTVQALNKQDTFEQNYADFMAKMYKKSIKKISFFGSFYGLSQSITFFSYAATFALGSYLVEQGEMEFKNVFKVFMAITFSGMAVGRAGSMAPDFSKAKVSASKIFMLLDREPEIDSFSLDGAKPNNCTGEVEFSGAKFSYPSRPGIQVLQGLDLQVKPGQTLALVGSSGCGKSTTVQLIERFYDAAVGVVNLDGNNIKNLNVQWLRRQLGIVSQEPVLFDTNIKDNIAYGDNGRHVPMSEIIEAARKANIHNFIESLPMGYDTNVGDKGTQLSGGQKQRVAIARALIRNPKVLLLDEATSALDTESEKVVQEALDRAREGRTSIVIAHRLSTIINADTIAVIHNGTVVEQGTHPQLMAKQGFYYRLQRAQNRSKTSDL